MDIKELQIIDTSQKLYDNFNEFIISDDTKVFGKLLARTLLAEKVKNIPGDIVECGVFKGTGIITFLKLKRYMCPNSLKKVVGFDFFDSESLIKGISNEQDTEAMSSLFSGRNFKHDKNYKDFLDKKIGEIGFDSHEYTLVQGDVSQTTKDYVDTNPGFRISLLYLDLDLDIPTYDALTNLWKRVSKGGIVVFDEYAFDKWSESDGVDRFFEDKNVKIETLNYICPSAYVVKK